MTMSLWSKGCKQVLVATAAAAFSMPCGQMKGGAKQRDQNRSHEQSFCLGPNFRASNHRRTSHTQLSTARLAPALTAAMGHHWYCSAAASQCYSIRLALWFPAPSQAPSTW